MMSHPILPVMTSTPASLETFMEKLREMGYLDFEVLDAEYAHTADFPLDPRVAIALLSSRSELNEVGRVLSSLQVRHPELVGFAVLADRAPFSAEEVYAQGFEHFYRLPFEEDVAFDKLLEKSPTTPANADVTLDHLMRVSVGEIEAAKKLPFDIYLYLPMNRRAILYFPKGRLVDEGMLSKFRSNANYNLYILRSQIKEYVDYCSTLFDSNHAQLDDIVKKRKTGERVRSILGDFLNDQTLSSSEIKLSLDNLKGLVNEIHPHEDSSEKWRTAISTFTRSRMNHFDHANNVAAYCWLFGTALGVSAPEELRLGGLLHDIGLIGFEQSALELDLDDMSPALAAEYRQHPKTGIEIAKERNLPLSETVKNMILYHHENPDGSGYPFGKRANEIPVEAKICAFADEFDKLTSVRAGKRLYSPGEAMRRIAGLDGHPPEPIYEAKFHGPLVKMFLEVAPRKETPETRRPVSKVRVLEDDTPQLSNGNVITIGELLKQPKFQRNDDEQPAWVHTAGAQVEIQDIRAQLRSHWLKGKA